MRTTLTLEDSVADGLKRLQRRHPERTFKDLVNTTLKAGLAAEGEGIRVPFKIRALNNARPKEGLNFDCINELISQVEGDFHK